MRGRKGLSVSIAFGHNASKWLAELLHRPEQGVAAYHELKFKHYRPWKRAFQDELKYGIADKRFKSYWDAVNQDMRKHHVFDSNSWSGHMIPELANYTRLRNVVYVTRNGIDWLYSVTSTSSYNIFMRHPKSWVMHDLIKIAWENMGKPFKDNFDDFTVWEKMCLSWAKSFYVPAWLESNIEQPVLVYRVESLTGGDKAYHLLDKFSLSLAPRQIRKLQKQKINQHVVNDAEKDTKSIWRSWTSEQQEAFRVICGEGMDYYEYKI